MAFEKQLGLPLIYSCGGCSAQAQCAHDIAVVMHREGYAQLSCIVGVGNQINELVELAQSGRPIMAMDGCGLGCVKRTLALCGVEPTWHIDLKQLVIEQNDTKSYSYTQMNRALRIIQALLTKPVVSGALRS
jgi:uncharacterized metal-binding protein